MKISKTNKLYRGKWVYRLLIPILWGRILAHGGNNVRQQLDRFKETAHKFRSHEKFYDDIEGLLAAEQIFNVIEPHLSTNTVALRSYNSGFEILCNDLGIVNSLKTDFQKYIDTSFEPEASTVALLESAARYNTRIVLREKLPYGKYTHRVVIRVGKGRMDTKQDLVEWIARVGEKVAKAPKGLSRGARYHWATTSYFYVNGEDALTLFALSMGECIRYVEKYEVISNDKKANTPKQTGET